MSITFRPMTMNDYEPVLTLWQNSEGVGLSEADAPERIARFLQHNPGLSYVAYAEQVLAGAVLCGCDGRRGYLHHLAVAPTHRRQGIGRELVVHCLTALRDIDIDKCHLFVFTKNETAIQFWREVGWAERVELSLMSRLTA